MSENEIRRRLLHIETMQARSTADALSRLRNSLRAEADREEAALVKRMVARLDCVLRESELNSHRVLTALKSDNLPG